MHFCDDCGAMITPQSGDGRCENFGAKFAQSKPNTVSGDIEDENSGVGMADGGTQKHTELESLPTTKSGTIPKSEAMEWLKNRDRPSSAELKRATVEKPSDFDGEFLSRRYLEYSCDRRPGVHRDHCWTVQLDRRYGRLQSARRNQPEGN